MKTLVLPVFGLLLFAFSPVVLKSQDFQPGLGIALKASTNGIGGDVAYGLHEKWTLRLGFEKLGYDRDITFSESDVEYEAVVDYTSGSISLLCDYSIARWFFITGGAGYNLFHGNVDGQAASSLPFGDIEIPKEMIGDFSFEFDPGLKISPYLGIGFGQSLSKFKRIAFAFEMGAFYQGPADITIHSTGLLSPTSNPDHGQEARLEKQVNQYYLFPVLKLSLSFRIVEF